MKPTIDPELKHDHLLGVVKGLKSVIGQLKEENDRLRRALVHKGQRCFGYDCLCYACRVEALDRLRRAVGMEGEDALCPDCEKWPCICAVP